MLSLLRFLPAFATGALWARLPSTLVYSAPVVAGAVVVPTRGQALYFGLLWLTDWSYNNYMLLHRWLGYWTIANTPLHSVFLLAYYVARGDYQAELTHEYWVWGVVGAVAGVAIVRRKVYGFFVASRVPLSLPLIVGYYRHIWYCYEHHRGDEI